LTLSLDDVKKSSASGNQSFRINELLKVQVETSGSDYRKDPYTLTCLSYSDGSFWIEFTVSRPKMAQKVPSVPIKQFEFQVRTTLTELMYIGMNESDQHPYLSQFSQLNFAESIKNQHIATDYSTAITTLRLKDNIIQVIEDNDEETGEQLIKK
jgi:hypothetical protein